MALSNFSEINYDKNKKSIQPQKKYTKYFHYGQQVCPVTFHFLHTIGRKRLKNLTHHFKENGLIPRVHGNTKQPPTSLLLNILFNFWSIMQIKMQFFCPAVYLVIVTQTSNYFPLVFPSVAYGKCIRSLLSQQVSFILLSTQHFVFSGVLYYHPLF